MTIKTFAFATLVAVPLFGSVTPAYADFCIQLNGGSFSGDIGFFRFRGDVPTVVGTIKTMRGRVAGLGPVFGTAVVTKDGATKTLEIGASFFADATQGQIDMASARPAPRPARAMALTAPTGPATA